MTKVVDRGQVGRENVWNLAQEGGFIAYLRGNIGDLPQRSEELSFADGRTLDDSFGLTEVMLSGNGVTEDEVASYTESTVITNG
jgi:hypothetical protein